MNILAIYRIFITLFLFEGVSVLVVSLTAKWFM